MTSFCVYFGTDHPGDHLTPSTVLTDLDVVLEPYHPLVKEGGFAEVFPHARRFVYVNPTTVDPWELERMADPPPLLGIDERWNLPRIDLESADGFSYAVRAAVRALEQDGGRCHGAFVDDLDRLLPDQEGVALDFMADVTHELGREPAWFLNRGFSLWSRVEGLAAVLLEDMTPDLVAGVRADEASWVRDEVLPRLAVVRERGVRVHCLGYLDQEHDAALATPDDQLRHDFAELVDSTTTGINRAMDDWKFSR